jgi:hypothetical protein
MRWRSFTPTSPSLPQSTARVARFEVATGVAWLQCRPPSHWSVSSQALVAAYRRRQAYPSCPRRVPAVESARASRVPGSPDRSEHAVPTGVNAVAPGASWITPVAGSILTFEPADSDGC